MVAKDFRAVVADFGGDNDKNRNAFLLLFWLLFSLPFLPSSLQAWRKSNPEHMPRPIVAPLGIRHPRSSTTSSTQRKRTFTLMEWFCGKLYAWTWVYLMTLLFLYSHSFQWHIGPSHLRSHASLFFLLRRIPTKLWKMWRRVFALPFLTTAPLFSQLSCSNVGYENQRRDQTRVRSLIFLEF